MNRPIEPAPVLARVACMVCGATLRAAEPGHEGDPVSHGLGPCCWDQWRAENGLGPLPYPGDAR